MNFAIYSLFYKQKMYLSVCFGIYVFKLFLDIKTIIVSIKSKHERIYVILMTKMRFFIFVKKEVVESRN